LTDTVEKVGGESCEAGLMRWACRLWADRGIWTCPVRASASLPTNERDQR
jgi:hypothetical protein